MRYIPNRLYHGTPEWTPEYSPFHIRFALADRRASDLIVPETSAALLASVREYHAENRWWCDLFLLMPDHAHAILRFPAERNMSREIANWKRGRWKFQGIDWQKGYWDHRLRSPTEFSEKWSYIRRNPIVRNLCAQESDWPHWWSPHEPRE